MGDLFFVVVCLCWVGGWMEHILGIDQIYVFFKVCHYSKLNYAVRKASCQKMFRRLEVVYDTVDLLLIYIYMCCSCK